MMNWRESKSTKKGNLFWFIDACSSTQRQIIKSAGAIFNRYPRVSIVCMKRDFHILMKKYQTFFKEQYDFIPETYILPEDYKAYKRYLDTDKEAMLLGKPSKGRGGQGIFFVKKYSDLDQESMKSYDYVAQHYIQNPYLIDNKKFDFRMYLMIKGTEEMEAYIAFEGLVRFCTEDYQDPTPLSDSDDEAEGEHQYMEDKPKDNLMGHLTNYCLNKESDKYVDNTNFKESDKGTKRLLSNILKVMKEGGIDIEKFKKDTKDICTKLVYALRPHIVNNYHTEMGTEESHQNCFHIFGLDLMIDVDHKVWVLEINAFPSFNYFHDCIVIDPVTKLKEKVKKVSELDRYLKTLIMKEAFLIAKGDYDKCDGTFQKCYPPEDESEFVHLSIYDEIRILFENLCKPQSPDYLNLAQFECISEHKNLRTEALTKSDYTTVFKEHAKSGNRSLMSLNGFNKAIDALSKIIYPPLDTKLERMVKFLGL